jgi:propane monooxygenase reductase subunit
MSPRVVFQPIGEEIECASDETVLDAAFRNGYNLAYGCREGQCSACKCYLIEGEVALKRYSTFALAESEQANGYTLMCRAMPEQDLVIELLHFDPEGYRLEHPIRDGVATVEAVEALTHDIKRLVLRVDEPADFAFVPGQYVDLHIPGAEGARRSFSMANVPGDRTIELMIKCYAGGRLSGMLDGEIRPGQQIGFTGPYGAFRLRRGDKPILMVAGGSGMAPILSLLRQLAASGTERPVRFFYGARTQRDLFHLAEIEALGAQIADFRFTPVLSDEEWDGARGFVHDAVDAFLASGEIASPEGYMCGPPPMIDAAQEMLVGKHGVDERNIHHDKFTTSADAADGATAGGATAASAAAATASDDGAVSAPVKRLGSTNGAAPAGDESERQFRWFEPSKRRASLYEDVTIDTQPSVHRHLQRGWPMHFEDGRGIWSDDSTALRSTDWFAFRDPGAQWERPFYQRGTASENQIDGAIRSASSEGVFDDFGAEWVDFLRSYLQGPAYVEHGLWFALATIARDALSDSIANCIALYASMKQRSAQAIVLYAMDLEAHHGPFPIEDARERFLTEDAWQPTRRYLERLAATPDWGEVLVAANLCFEPLVGTLLRRELGIRAAAANGDTVTPVLARVAMQEWDWARAWSVALMQFVLADETHGAANRAVVGRWVGDWLPEAVQAALALAPIAERLPVGIDIEQAGQRVRAAAAAHLEDCGLPELLEVIGHEPRQPAPAPAPAVPAAPAASAPPRKAPARRTPADDATEGGGESHDYVGIVMAKSAEGDAVAAILAGHEGIEVLEQPSFWEIRAKDRLVIGYTDVSEELGYEIDAYSIQHEMSTHYGRMVATDEALMLFSDPAEAMEYLMA